MAPTGCLFLAELVCCSALAQAEFQLAVRDFALCGVSEEYTLVGDSTHSEALAAERARHVQVYFTDGRYVLPSEGSIEPFPLIASILFGSDATPATLSADPSVSRDTRETSPGTMRFDFTFFQPFTVGEDSFTALIVLPFYETVEGVAVEPVKRMQPLDGQRHIVFGGGLLIDIDACGQPGYALYDLLCESASGDRVEFRYRKRSPPVVIGNQPVQILQAVVDTGGSLRAATSYWDLIYSSDRHNTDERFAAKLVPPVGDAHYAAAYENVNWQTFEPEPYIELLDADLNSLGQRPATVFEITRLPDADADGVPDEVEGWPAEPGKTSRYLPDSDGDGLSDVYEDRDFDNVVDPGETDPRAYDSDNDRLEDGVEWWILATDPLDPGDPASYTDADGDGLPIAADPDDADPDSDDDRFLDGYEAAVDELDAASDPVRIPALGDLNRDGFVSNLDALIVQAVFIELSPPAAHDIANGDPTRDGYVSNADALLLQSFFIERWDHLPLKK